MAHSFHIPTSKAHFKWDNALAPALTVPSGSEITFDLKDGGNNQIRPENGSTCLAEFDVNFADPAFGPVYVEGAEPGDVLKVEIQSLDHADYGWTAILSGFGLLAENFPKQRVKFWDLSESALLPGTTGANGPRRAVFKPGISVPVRPFLGVIGIAPAEKGELSTIPPYTLSGGNMDTRYLGVGSTVYFPVQVPGALLSCGDGHAAQGDGEVCGTAIETPMKAKLKLGVIKKDTEGWMNLSSPHYTTPPRTDETAEDDLKGTYGVLGIHSDPEEAAKMALRGLVGWLEKTKGLNKAEGYMLASVAASLKMTEVVDMPNYAICCSIPLSTFDD